MIYQFAKGCKISFLFRGRLFGYFSLVTSQRLAVQPVPVTISPSLGGLGGLLGSEESTILAVNVMFSLEIL